MTFEFTVRIEVEYNGDDDYDALTFTEQMRFDDAVKDAVKDAAASIEGTVDVSGFEVDISVAGVDG